MKLTIRLGSTENNISDVLVQLPSDDPPISEIIDELRNQLSPWYIAVMERGIEGLDGPDGVDSVPGGLESLPKKASIFLALETASGLIRLLPTKRISDYKIDANSRLFLMCSAEYLANG